jgi:hypothetical protein
MAPQSSCLTTGAAHMLPPVHAGFGPHMHAPSTHDSPAAQHVLPHSGPVEHVADGAQLRPSMWTAASGILELEPEQPTSEMAIKNRII